MENKIIVYTPEKEVFSQPDLLIHIFSCLDLYDLIACMLVSKEFSKFTEQDELWQRQFQVHFPNIFKNFSKDALSIAGWYWKFQGTYQSKYIGKDPSEPFLNKESRKCITWAKEGNQEALIKILPSVNFEEFMAALPFFLAAGKNNQPLLDIFYEALLNNREVTRYNVGLFHCAIACHQPKNVIKSAKASWCSNRVGGDLFAVKWTLLYGDVDSFIDLIEKRPFLKDDLANSTNLAMCLLGACEEGQINAVTSLLNFAKGELFYTDDEIKTVVSTKYPVYKSGVFSYREKSSYKISVISVAVENGHTEIVKLLIEKTQPTLSGLVHLAAKEGYLDILQWLIAQDPKLVNEPDQYAQTAFLWAASCGHVPILEYLYYEYKEQINIEAKTIVDDDRAYEDGKTPLCWAAERGYVQTVKWLLEKNANVYAKTTLGAMPIHLAAQNGHLAIIKILLEKDAELLNAQDNEGKTPLIYTLDLHGVVEERDAPYQDRIYETQFFLYYKTDRNTLNAKRFICFAARKGWLNILRDIIGSKVNINVVQEIGLNPVSLALKQGYIETPKLLLDACPELVNESDSTGKLPVYYAKSPQQKALLEQYSSIKITNIEQFIARLLYLKQEQYSGYLESLCSAGQTPFDQSEVIIDFLQKLPPEKFNAFFQNAVMVGLLSLDRISDIENPDLEGENNNSYQSNSAFINRFIKPLNNERHTLEASIRALEAEINSLPDSSERKIQFLTLTQNLKKYTSGFFSGISGDQKTIEDSALALKQSYEELITKALNDFNEISTSEEREKIRLYQGIFIALHIFIITIPFIWAIRASRNCVLGKTDRCVKAEEVLEAVDEFRDKLPQYYPSIFAPAKSDKPTDLANEVSSIPPASPSIQ